MRCKDCKKSKKTHGPRCYLCYKLWNKSRAKKLRERKRLELLITNEELANKGKQVCARCFALLRITEFNTSLHNRKGKLNKICDRCLSNMYSHVNRLKSMNYGFWRRKAYSVNSTASQRLKREYRDKTLSIKHLEFICKPQDLIELFDKQSSKCHYCCVELTCDNLAVDHKTPLSVGGKHLLTNICLCCSDCNHLKHTKTECEMFSFLIDYTSRIIKNLEFKDKEL